MQTSAEYKKVDFFITAAILDICLATMVLSSAKAGLSWPSTTRLAGGRSNQSMLDLVAVWEWILLRVQLLTKHANIKPYIS